MAGATLFIRNGEYFIREADGTEHPAGDLAAPIEPAIDSYTELQQTTEALDVKITLLGQMIANLIMGD